MCNAARRARGGLGTQGSGTRTERSNATWNRPAVMVTAHHVLLCRCAAAPCATINYADVLRIAIVYINRVQIFLRGVAGGFAIGSMIGAPRILDYDYDHHLKSTIGLVALVLIKGL
jgi:hypothetical protein